MKKITPLLCFVFSMLTQYSYSQITDSTKNLFQLKGAVTVTNRGISLIPTFSLGKPAVIFDLSMGKRKLFFEPQLKFALEGKPWAFLFWGRYKLITTNKVLFTIGVHPALNFKTESFSSNGVTRRLIITRRYLAGELSPNYFVAKNISLGLYYLYSRGIDKEAVRNSHFLTINSNLSNIRLGNQFFARFAPQFYYLKQDGKDGIYVTSTLTLARKNFPLTIQSIINKAIQTNIVSESFVWNVSLIYSFSKKYAEE